MIRFKSFLTKSSMIYTNLIRTRAIIQRNQIVSPRRSKAMTLSQSSFLSQDYENLFLYSREAQSQNLLLSAGFYVVSCLGGSIEIFERGTVEAGEHFLLELLEEEEIFFIMSSDCYKPSIYEGKTKFPYTETITSANYLEFPKEVWTENRISYLQSLGSIPLEVEYIYVDGTLIGSKDDPGWSSKEKTISYVFIDDQGIMISDDFGIFGWYDNFKSAVQISYLRNRMLGSFDLNLYSTLCSYWKDIQNYIAVVVKGNDQLFLRGKIDGAPFIHSLGMIEQIRDSGMVFLSENHVYCYFQKRLYDFYFPFMFQFEKLYIGFDGITNYYNNVVEGVIV